MVEPRDPRNPAFLRLFSQVGNRLIRLYREGCPASKEFQNIGYEVKAFHASYQPMRPFLQPPSYFVSETGSDLIRSIYDGVETICEKLDHDVREFEDGVNTASRHRKRLPHRHPFAILQGRTMDRNRRSQIFLEERNYYSLERCQLRYGTTLLNLILAVLVYAQCIHNDESTPPFPDYARYLIEDLESTLGEVKTKEKREKRLRRVQNLPVEASWWWDGLPPRPPFVETLTPLEELARIWVNVEARLGVRPNADMQQWQRVLSQWREQNQQLRAALHRVDAQNTELLRTNQQLRSENIQHAQDIEQMRSENDQLRQAFRKLEDDTSELIDELEEERLARQKEEQSKTRYYSDYNHIKDRYNRLLREKETAEKTAAEYRQARDEALDDLERIIKRRDQASHREPRQQERASSRTHREPPVAFITRGHHKRRSSSSSERLSQVTTATNNDYYYPSHASSSKEPPPVRIATRPFPS